jgi:ABC-type antimicrobial peptide transport system permease subunit
MEAIGNVILWIILTIVTLGLALIVFPYYFNRAVLNQTEVLDLTGTPIGRLNCTFNVGHSIGHVLIWAILIIVTLGLAGFLYVYRVLRVVLNETRIEYY